MQSCSKIGHFVPQIKTFFRVRSVLLCYPKTRKNSKRNKNNFWLFEHNNGFNFCHPALSLQQNAFNVHDASTIECAKKPVRIQKIRYDTTLDDTKLGHKILVF